MDNTKTGIKLVVGKKEVGELLTNVYQSVMCGGKWVATVKLEAGNTTVSLDSEEFLTESGAKLWLEQAVKNAVVM